MKKELEKSLQILRKKVSNLKGSLKNERFMISVPTQTICKEFERLADEALILTFKSKEYQQLSKESYDLHEELNLLSRNPTQCAA